MCKKEVDDILALDIDRVKKEYCQWKREGTIGGTLINLIKPEKKIIKALDEVSFQVGKGEFLAYAGENGAGKSTTIKIMSGIIAPTSGSVKVLGMDPQKKRVELMKKVGILFGQRTELWWDHPVITSYQWKKDIWGISDKEYKTNLEMVTELLRLSDILETFTRELSLGQRLKADIGMMLLHSPEMIILDEPTLGLDVLAKQKVIAFLKSINKERGTTIVVTSHDMRELEEMAQRIILLSQGKVVYDGSFEQLRKKENSTMSYKVTYLGEAPRLKGMELKSSNGYLHEYRLTYGNPQNFFSQISKIDGIINIEISKEPIEEVISNIYQRGGEGYGK